MLYAMIKTLLFFLSFTILIACGNASKTASTTNKANVLENPFLGISWKINSPAFIDETAASYTLTPPAEEKEKFPNFGHFVQFNEDGTFRGYYSAMCGNDCFTSVDGNYTLTTDNQVKIFIKKALNSGFCNDTLLIEKKDMGKFEIITQKDKSLLLKKK